jgi:hypothetical protein
MLGRVAELYFTRRFIENPAAASVIELANAHGVKFKTPVGAAEFELDFIGNGVAALLRPQLGRVN